MAKRARGRSVSIRWSLFKNLLLLIVLISGALLVYSVAGANRAIGHLSGAIIGEASSKVGDRLGRFFAPMSKSVELMRELGGRGVFSPADPRAANSVLIPVLSTIPQMSAVNTGNERGDTLLILKRKQEWLNISTKGGPGIADWKQVDEKGQVLKAWRQELDFDPRSRPWYRMAAGAADGEVRWTAPYRFLPNGDPGITAAVRVESPKGAYVLAFDILLEDLAAFAKEINVSRRGLAFVMTEDDQLLVPPAAAGDEVSGMLLKTPDELSLPLLAESVRLRRERPRGEPFQVQYHDEAWWCGFEPYQLSAERKFWIGVLIPEGDLLGDAERDRFALLVLTAGALALAALMSLLLSRAYSRPLRQLVEHSARLQRLQTDVEVHVDSRLREVRQLAGAQESMRLALDSFARYVPIEVVRELLERGEAATIGGEDVEVTVLFTDIVGFTAIAESMSAADLTRHMSAYFDEFVGVLQRRGATVDKLIGDAIMAFWGAPQASPDHARQAVEAVLELRERIDRANAAWAADGLPQLPTRFGLASGEVTVGNIGAHRRLNYTALGDPVNLAHRLEALNSQLGTWILADENVRRKAGPDFEWRETEAVEIKGKSAAIRVFELLGRKAARKAVL